MKNLILATFTYLTLIIYTRPHDANNDTLPLPNRQPPLQRQRPWQWPLCTHGAMAMHQHALSMVRIARRARDRPFIPTIVSNVSISCFMLF